MSFFHLAFTFSTVFLLDFVTAAGQPRSELQLDTLVSGWIAYRQEFSTSFKEGYESRQVDSIGGVESPEVTQRCFSNCYQIRRFDGQLKCDRIWVSNSKYTFEILLNRQNSGSAHMARCQPISENPVSDLNLFEPPALRFHFAFKLLTLVDYIEIQSLKRSANDTEVEMKFILNQDYPGSKSKFRIRNGVLVFNNDRFFLPKRASFDIKGISDEQFQKVDISYRYDNNKEIPFLITEVREFHNSPILTQRIDFSPLENQISEKDFTLTSHGLPEPDFLKSSNFNLVFRIVLVSLVISLIVFWMRR